MSEAIRIYADTSVFGGAFDSEFSHASTLFFDLLRSRTFGLVTSALVRQELDPAPAHVLKLYREFLQGAEEALITDDALDLRDAYLSHKVVSPRSSTDALHVAIATVQACTMIVSWNFKDIVNFRRIPLFNAVNKLNGYREVGVYSPLEVISGA